MINHFVTSDDEIEEPEELNDDDATLADDLLDEVTGDDAETDDDTVEGFGILPEKEDEDDDEEKDEDDLGEDDTLEEDAEDVDFDTFDDIDEM